MRAEAAQRESEDRQLFLFKLSDALRPLAGASEIKTTASRVLGEHLLVDRAFYAEVHGDDWSVESAYEHAVESQAVGRHPMAQFGQWILDLFGRGENLVIGDLQTDGRFESHERAAHETYRIRDAVAVPLVKKGKLVAILFNDITGRRRAEEVLQRSRRYDDISSSARSPNVPTANG